MNIDDALAHYGAAQAQPPTLEEVLTSPEWFGLETASPLQRAICRWAEGLPVDMAELAAQMAAQAEGYAPDIAERMTAQWVLGGMVSPERRPVEVVLVAGIRTGKSLLDAAIAVWASQRVTIRDEIPSEEHVRFSIVSVDKDKARAVLMHLFGAIERSSKLRGLVVGELKADGVDLRHPRGHVVEIRVAHGGRAGKGLVSYWSAGCIFDEAPRMVGEDEGVVNLDDARKAVLGRLLPGAQAWYTGSPWAPMGPVYDLMGEHHGSPGEVLALRAPAPALNPVTWTPEECESVRGRSPEAFRMDVLAEWGTPESMMFDADLVSLVMRTNQEPPNPCYPELHPIEFPPVMGEHYTAAMDPSGRGGNAFTLVIGGKRLGDNKPRLMLARQWFPSAEFTEGDVFRAMKPLLDLYGVRFAYTDNYAPGFVESLAREVGISTAEIRRQDWTAENKLDAFDSLKVMMREQRVELLDAPLVREDLMRTKRKLTQSGATVTFTNTGDGRHCDFAPAIAMWATMPMADPVGPKTKEERVREWEEQSLAAEFAPSKKRRRFPRRRR